ncbi:alpha/beta fold hydrolase [Pseudonocardia acidicola]|uniref:Alpha/beta hydrolase n=1 Tax=Pseudonocardia acidicola TaxID=2724939 RepID=A0ABX1SBV5_9PSEU|nr:alpha/beta fold hydrolase [Pseudonocardia acidicola]NMH99054.1 alpha/beta hydrolase [Pseudonocardia acidicola]
MTGFVLVHGAWHDASCWAAVQAELAGRGYPVVGVDLPADRPGLGADAYADAVLAAADTLPDAKQLVLVGHSLGGLTVPVVAQRLGPERVRALVLVAALVPRPGMSYDDQRRADRSIMAPGFGAGQERHEDGTTSWPAAAAVSGLYRGVEKELPADAVDAAVGRLRRQAWQIGCEVTPLTAWPAVRTVSVVCTEDQVVDPGWSRRAAAGIGADVVELPGGHFPMLTRPVELADVLVAAGDD